MEAELALFLSSMIGAGIVARLVIEGYIAVFWLFWDIVDAVV